jgi:hypothetical protein
MSFAGKLKFIIDPGCPQQAKPANCSYNQNSFIDR